MEIIIAIIITCFVFALLLITFACIKVSSEADEFAESEYKKFMSEKIQANKHM